MGAKGSNQVSTTQTYTPNKYISQAGQQALTGAESAAQQPFQMPVAPVAGFSPYQEQAFGATEQALGMAQPYFGAGAGYLAGSAAPITGQDVGQYYNPMAQNITNQMQNIFGQQMRETTGNLTGAAGGVGASRIAVGQGNLANQQGLAAGQTYANLYQQALQAAQQQKQMMAGAGYGLGQMGPAAQMAQLQSIGALGQAGAQQQALQQAQLSAQYQNQLARIAYPFQTPQYLAGIAGGLGPAMGGTTTGVTTYPTPSPLAQGLGIGTSLLGLAGGFGGLGTGLGQLGGGFSALGSGFGSMFGGSSYPYYGPGYQRGGSTYGNLAEQYGEREKALNPYHNIDMSETAPGEWNYADGGDVDQQQPPLPFPGASVPVAGGVSPIPTSGQMQRGISPIPYAPVRSAPANTSVRHIPLYQPTMQQETLGSDISSALRLLGSMNKSGLAAGGSVNPYDFGHGFQGGGDIEIPDIPVNPDTFADRFAPATASPPVVPTDVTPRDALAAGLAAQTAPTPYPRPDIAGPPGQAFRSVGQTPYPTQEGIAAPDRTSRRAGDVQQIISREWSAAGMPPQAIAGIHMNVADESGFNPTLRHPDQPRWGGEAHYAHGLYQEGGAEWNNYQRWLNENAPGADWRDPALQSRFTAQNLRENYPQVWNRMANAKTPGEAAVAFLQGYLKPAQQYQEARANKYLGSGADAVSAFAGPEGEGQLPPNVQLAEYRPPGIASDANRYQLPQSMRPYPGAQQRDWGQQMARSPWMSLVKAGAEMATSVGPIGSVIGKGIKAGAGELEGQRKALQTEEEINQKAQSLYQQAQQHLDQYQRMTPYQQEEIGIRKQLVDKQLQQLELEGLKPFHIGDDPETGLAIYGIRDPKDPTGRKVIPIDPRTGQVRAEGPSGTAAPATPIAETKASMPAPLGMDEFRPNLSPTKATGPQMVKGPFATAEAGNIRNIDAAMNKSRDAIDVQRDQLNRLKLDYSTVMKDSDKDGFFQRLMTMPGADPESRVAAMRTANLAAASAGKAPVFNPEKVAAMEEAIKIQKTMGMSFAATISPRDAMQMQLASISAQPGFTQSPQGMQRLIGLYDGLVNHSEAKHDFWGRWKQTNPRTAAGWEEDFRSKNPVDMYTVRALIDNMPNQRAKDALPKAVDYLKQHKDDPAEVAKFDKIFNNTSSFFLNGRLDPYAPLR